MYSVCKLVLRIYIVSAALMVILSVAAIVASGAVGIDAG
jgi:hypothetical protein